MALIPAVLFFLATGAGAQSPEPVSAPENVISSITVAPGAINTLGESLSLEKGPWVIGEVLIFTGTKLASEPSWRERIRGRRGMLYTKSDIANDISELKSLDVFTAVEPALHSMPDSPVPPEFASIAVSTHQVRLVFTVTEKAPASPIAAAPAPKSAIPPAAISGVVLTPTAYRGAGRYASPGLGLDINAAYFIGRLYGKNKFENTVRKVNYIDRIGVWLLTADGKMQVQSESTWRPAVAVGAMGAVLLRDAPQGNITTPNFSVKITDKTTRLLSDAYFVASKKIHMFRTSVGFMQGDMGNAVGALSEYLTPQSLEFYANRKGGRVMSASVPFASILILPKPAYPLAVEFMKFNGAHLNPILINFKLGYFLKLNFDIAYLKFDGGYDVLGTFQFRYNHFPRR